MKKSKLLAGVLVASMALLGTGYAYWTDQLTLTASVETGNLEVNYVTETTEGTRGELDETKGTDGKEPVYGEYLQLTPAEWDEELDGVYPWNNSLVGKHGKNGWGIYHTTGWHGSKLYGKLDDCATCTPTHASNSRKHVVTPGQDPVKGGEVIDGEGYVGDVIAEAKDKGVSIKVENLYPGSFATANFTAINDGTIPAVIDTVVLNDKLSDFESKLKVVAKVSAVGKGDLDVEAVDQGDIDTALFLSDIGKVLADAYNNAQLEPGDMIKTELTIIFPGDAATGDEFEKLTGESFELEINWIQHNALTTKAKEVVPAE